MCRAHLKNPEGTWKLLPFRKRKPSTFAGQILSFDLDKVTTANPDVTEEEKLWTTKLLKTNLSLDRVLKEQKSDPLIRKVFNFLNEEDALKRALATPRVKNLARISTIRNGIVYNTVYPRAYGQEAEHLRLWIPKALVSTVVTKLHDGKDNNHLGLHKTIDRVTTRYFWPLSNLDIRSHVSNCVTCTRAKEDKKAKERILKSFVPKFAMECVGVDLITNLTITPRGYKNIMVMVDWFTKYAIAIPTKTKNAEEITKLIIEHWFLRFSYPNRLLSDGGGEFSNALQEEVSRLLGYEKIFTSPNSPWTNGLTERMNGTIIPMLRSISENENRDDWDEKLPYVMFAYNTSVQASTQYTPHEMVFGYLPRLSVDRELLEAEDWIPMNELTEDYAAAMKKIRTNLKIAHETAREFIVQAQERQRRNFNAKHATGSVKKAMIDIADSLISKKTKPRLIGEEPLRKRTIAPGSWVFIWNLHHEGAKKLAYRWDGPYIALKPVGEEHYEIAGFVRNNVKLVRKVHISRMKVYTRHTKSEELKPPKLDQRAKGEILEEKKEALERITKIYEEKQQTSANPNEKKKLNKDIQELINHNEKLAKQRQAYLAEKARAKIATEKINAEREKQRLIEVKRRQAAEEDIRKRREQADKARADRLDRIANEERERERKHLELQRKKQLENEKRKEINRKRAETRIRNKKKKLTEENDKRVKRQKTLEKLPNIAKGRRKSQRTVKPPKRTYE